VADEAGWALVRHSRSPSMAEKTQSQFENEKPESEDDCDHGRGRISWSVGIRLKTMDKKIKAATTPLRNQTPKSIMGYSEEQEK
jgi:hypothetical protein